MLCLSLSLSVHPVASRASPDPSVSKNAGLCPQGSTGLPAGAAHRLRPCLPLLAPVQNRESLRVPSLSLPCNVPRPCPGRPSWLLGCSWGPLPMVQPRTTKRSLSAPEAEVLSRQKKKGFKSFFLKWIEMLGCASVLSPRIFSNFPLLYLLRAAGAVVTRAGIMGEWVRGEFGNETHSLCFSSGFKGVSVFRLRQRGNRHSQTQAHIPADSSFQQCTGRAGRRGGAQGWGMARLRVRSPVLMGWSRAEL